MGIWHREGREGQANRWRGNNRLVPHLKLERGPPCRRQPPIIHRDGHRIKVGSSMAGWDTGKVWIEALWASLSFCVGRKGLGISFLLHGKKKNQVKGHVICHRVNALKRQTRLVSRTWWKQKHKTKTQGYQTHLWGPLHKGPRDQTGLDQQRRRTGSPPSS